MKRLLFLALLSSISAYANVLYVDLDKILKGPYLLYEYRDIERERTNLNESAQAEKRYIDDTIKHAREEQENCQIQRRKNCKESYDAIINELSEPSRSYHQKIAKNSDTITSRIKNLSGKIAVVAGAIAQSRGASSVIQYRDSSADGWFSRPIYIAAEFDITSQVVARLNEIYLEEQLAKMAPGTECRCKCNGKHN